VAQKFILLSHERSGSHLAGDFIGSLPNFRMIDEVCNSDAVKPAKHTESFHRYKYDFLLVEPAYMLEPSRHRHNDFLVSYFAHLAKLRAPNHIAVDIKYGHVQNFEWWWAPPLVRPFLINFCQEQDIGIVHLYRENVIEATVSGMIADKRKIWHSWQPGADADAGKKFALNVREAIRRSKLLQRQTQLFKDWTGGTRRVAVTYEEIAAQLGHGKETDAKLFKFFGSSLKSEFQTRYQKVTRPLPEIVENYGELKETCDKEGLGWCLP
jgi:hypothetical protein